MALAGGHQKHIQQVGIDQGHHEPHKGIIDAIWKSEDDKKPPKGFEKFFKKKEERENETS